VVLITDGCTGIGEGSLGHTSLPRYGYQLHVACIADTRDQAFLRSEPLYRRLVAEVATSGEVFVPEGSLCERSVQQMFVAICDKHYVPFTGTLRCGNLQCPVHVFPAPEDYCRLAEWHYSWSINNLLFSYTVSFLHQLYGMPLDQSQTVLEKDFM